VTLSLLINDTRAFQGNLSVFEMKSRTEITVSVVRSIGIVEGDVGIKEPRRSCCTHLRFGYSDTRSPILYDFLLECSEHSS